MYTESDKDVITNWYDGVVYHSIREWGTHSYLEVRPVLVQKYNKRNRLDWGSNLFIKVIISDNRNPRTDSYEGKLALYLDYYRLFEFHKFLEKYVDLIMQGKIFIKQDGIVSIPEKPYELNHISDKNKSVKLSPYLDADGPKIQISFKVGAPNGLYDGGLICTVTELVVLASATGTLLNQFSIISETMMNRAFSSSQNIKNDLKILNQRLNALEQMIVNIDIREPIPDHRTTIKDEIFEDDIPLPELGNNINLNISINETDSDVMKDLKMFMQTSELEQEEKVTATELITSDTCTSSISKFMKENSFTHIGEITDMMQNCAIQDEKLFPILFQDIIVPMILDDYSPLFDQEKNAAALKSTVTCIKNSDREEDIKKFMYEYSEVCYPVFASVWKGINKYNKIATEELLIKVSENIPNFSGHISGGKIDGNYKDQFNHIMSSFLDFLILDQFFGYISSTLKFKSSYLLINRYIIRWGILPILWGDCIRTMKTENIVKAFDNVWSYWRDNHDQLFSYMINTDIISDIPETKDSLKNEIDRFFKTKFGYDHLRNSAIPYVNNVSNNVKILKPKSIELAKDIEELIPDSSDMNSFLENLFNIKYYFLESKNIEDTKTEHIK